MFLQAIYDVWRATASLATRRSWATSWKAWFVLNPSTAWVVRVPVRHARGTTTPASSTRSETAPNELNVIFREFLRYVFHIKSRGTSLHRRKSTFSEADIFPGISTRPFSGDRSSYRSKVPVNFFGRWIIRSIVTSRRLRSIRQSRPKRRTLQLRR